MLRPLAAGLALAGALAGFDFAATKKTGPLTDQAQVVRDPGGAQRVGREVEALRRARGIRAAVLTLPGLQGEPADDVAAAIRRAWGDDVLILLSVPERRTSISARQGLVIDAAAVLERMAPDLEQDRYGAALSEAVRALGGAPPAKSAFSARYLALLAPLGVLAWIMTRKPKPERAWPRGGAFRASGSGGFGGASR